ncbi:SRPBCC family protein [Actinopolymorpha alba]|uniref:SRPBCC family protein n=1 Tax=Actinopolymorpha alba TaxID=533267 RepID=UPI00037EECA3|nr:SRPBCC family protein [Actinopolymorpha alba]
MSQTTSRPQRESVTMGDVTKGLREAAAKNPATQRLVEEAQAYLVAQVEHRLTNLGGRLGAITRKASGVVEEVAEAGPGGFLGRAAKEVVGGASPPVAATKAGLKGITEKVKSAFKRGGKAGGGKSMNIIEDVDVGVPLRVAYNHWTKFSEFPRWSKATQSVDQEDPTKSSWKAKIAFSNRNWKATTMEQIPDERIAWRSEGQTIVNGVVTFHPLEDNLTKVLVVLEYVPHGFFEKTANLWRAQGRRARLDIKLFRRYVMMQADPEEEGWRGEIREGEIVREHDEVMREEEERERGEGLEREEAERRRVPEQKREPEAERARERQPERATPGRRR